MTRYSRTPDPILDGVPDAKTIPIEFLTSGTPQGLLLHCNHHIALSYLLLLPYYIYIYIILFMIQVNKSPLLWRSLV